MRFAYLHGFASGPLSTKGRRLRAMFEREGHALWLPDLNAPSFRELSFEAMLERVDRMDAAEGDADGWGLIGSSLGGWVAARWGELNPERVRRVLLLCPAFDVARRWPTILPAGAMERWARGSLPVPDGTGTPQPLHYRFYEESTEQPAFPHLSCPTRIVHGVDDDRVPIESSRAYAAQRAHVTLVEVQDGHQLLSSMAVIEREARALRGARYARGQRGEEGRRR